MDNEAKDDQLHVTLDNDKWKVDSVAHSGRIALSMITAAVATLLETADMNEDERTADVLKAMLSVVKDHGFKMPSKAADQSGGYTQ